MGKPVRDNRTAFMKRENRLADREDAVIGAARRHLLVQGMPFVACCSRLGGAEGLGLAWAYQDMVRTGEVPPSGWPLPDIIALLRSGADAGDLTAAAQLSRIRRIARDVKRLELQHWLADSDPEAEASAA